MRYHIFIISFVVNRYYWRYFSILWKGRGADTVFNGYWQWLSGSVKMSDLNLTSLIGILSIPGAFLEFRDFMMVLISLGFFLEPQLEEGIEMELDCKFLFSWIFAVLRWFMYLSKIELKTTFLLLDPIQILLFQV